MNQQYVNDVIKKFLTIRGKGGATDDEMSFYLHLDEEVIQIRAMQEMLASGEITAVWQEKRKDWLVYLKGQSPFPPLGNR